MQEDRLRQVLGTGKQDSEPKLLFLMIAQKEKYEKWLFRVLMVLIDLLVREGVREKSTLGCSLMFVMSFFFVQYFTHRS